MLVADGGRVRFVDTIPLQGPLFVVSTEEGGGGGGGFTPQYALIAKVGTVDPLTDPVLTVPPGALSFPEVASPEYFLDEDNTYENVMFNNVDGLTFNYNPTTGDNYYTIANAGLYVIEPASRCLFVAPDGSSQRPSGVFRVPRGDSQYLIAGTKIYVLTNVNTNSPNPTYINTNGAINRPTVDTRQIYFNNTSILAESGSVTEYLSITRLS